MCDFTNPIYTEEDKAREHLEKVRWPNGPVCPHCGSQNVHRLAGQSTRPGLLKCRDCRKPFSVTVGTVFERSKIPLTKWLLATHLLAASKKGMSAHQLHRMLGVTYKTAWFMAHRIREAMKPSETPVMGSGGGIVEADDSLKEYVRGAAHVNTAENFFSVFKRGMKGVYQHCSGDLHRYLVEFDFRYNHRAALEITDRERARIALEGISGKRLMYKGSAEAHSAA